VGWSTRQVAAYYEFTEQTVRKWTLEFSPYFSPTATPGKEKNREFSLEDLGVIALIAEMKKRKATFDEIHAALATGQRGDPPDLSEKDLDVLAANTGEKRANLEIEMLQRSIIDLSRRLQAAEERAAQVDKLEKENVRLETRLEMTAAELALAQKEADNIRASLEADLREVREKIDKLNREIGEQYTRGVMDTLERLGHLPKGQGRSQESDT